MPGTAPPSSFAAVRAALTALAADEELFYILCMPSLGKAARVERLDPTVLAGLVDGGVVVVREAHVVPRLWVALQNGRPYFMSLNPRGTGDSYSQDLWPETHAMLDRLRGAPPGTFLDVGTGSGVVAVEAALAGHQVTATDLYPDVLELAAWNAALHGVSIELLRGHLLQPAAGRRFDLVMSAPHYTGPADLLRVEALRAGPAVVAPGGALFITTFLESQAGRLGVVESILRPMADAGAAVTVRPMPKTRKIRWFTEPVPGGGELVGRHRFTIEIRPDGPAGLTVQLPAPEDLEREVVVPLSRLVGARADRGTLRGGLDAHTAGAWDRRPAATVGQDDLAALEWLLGECGTGVVEMDQPVPFALHDACRFGKDTCVQAHRAIVDDRGGVRPCSHGGRVGSIDDSSAGFHQRMLELRAELEARRGCATCPAEKQCSKCAFPAAVDENGYCELIRRQVGALPFMHRFLKLMVQRFPESVGAGRVAVKLGPSSRRIAARRAPAARDASLADLAASLSKTGSTLVVVDGQAFLDIPADEVPFDLSPFGAEIFELVIDGAGRSDLHAYAGERQVEPGAVDALLDFVGKWLAA